MRNYFKVVTPAAISLVTIGDLKNQLNLGTDTDFDDILAIHLISAQDIVARELGEYVASTVISVGFRYFEPRLTLPHRQIIALDSVSYYETDGGTPVAVDDDNYFLDTSGQDLAVVRTQDGIWPSGISLNNTYPILVEYDAGYASISDVPESIAMAILIVASDLFQNRESSSDIRLYETPISAKRLLASYRRY